MIELERELRQIARQLLESGQVTCIIGWGATAFSGQTRPVFIEKPEDSSQLVINEHCQNMLAKYSMAESKRGKIALCTRGCEGRAINRLLADNQLQRENLYLIGLPCPGMGAGDGSPAEKCRLCAYPNPLDYDVLLGQPQPQREQEERFAGVGEIMQLDADSRYEFWQRVFSKCLRCYACRNACPACHCPSCFVERHNVGWQGKQHNGLQNSAFLLMRAFHLAGRCVECGECQRVCPVGLPLMLLNRKLLLDEGEIFGNSEHGLAPDEKPLLGSYSQQDFDEFM